MEIRGLCNICGKPGRMYTCSLCGGLVCSSCYEPRHGVCSICKSGNRSMK